MANQENKPKEIFQDNVSNFDTRWSQILSFKEMEPLKNYFYNTDILEPMSISLLSVPPIEKMRELLIYFDTEFTFFENFEINELAKNIRKWICASLAYDKWNSYDPKIDIAHAPSIFFYTFGLSDTYKGHIDFPFSYKELFFLFQKLRNIYKEWINKNFRINMDSEILAIEEIKTINSEVENFWIQLSRADKNNFELFDSAIQDFISTMCRPLFFNLKGLEKK